MAVEVNNMTTKPSCLHLHTAGDRSVPEHDCQLPKVKSKLVKCQGCGRHRAPVDTGVCWWCARVLEDSAVRKLPPEKVA